MPEPTLAWLDAITRLTCPSESWPQSLLMSTIEGLEDPLDGSARRFLELSTGAEVVHRLALSKALVGPERTLSYAEFRRLGGVSWAAALRQACRSPLLDVTEGGIRLHDRVEQVLLGEPVGMPLALPEVRGPVRKAAGRFRVPEGPLLFECQDRDFALEFAHALVGEELTAWQAQGPASPVWARLQSEHALLWMPSLSEPPLSPEGIRYLGAPSGEEADRLGLTRVLLDPLRQRIDGDESEDVHQPHLAPAAWEKPSMGLDALVLPDETMARLQGIVADLRRGLPAVVLLHGPPGTGKSFAARCLAGALGRRSYHVDGALLRGFYGQLEQRISDVQRHVLRDNAVLIIDEADTWFGHRDCTEGPKADEASTMLLMLERSQGVVVLTTNRVGALDPALWRRVTVDLEIPAPGPLERMALWGGLVPRVKPSTLAVLAALPLTGGDIRSTVLETGVDRSDESALVAAARRRSELRRQFG